MQTNIYLVPCPFPLASGSGCFPGFGLGITLEDRQQEALLSWLGVWGPGTWHNTSCNLLTVCILPPVPQNHRTFLYLSVESIAHLPPSLSAVYPLYFSFFLSLVQCQLNPLPFHLSPALSSVCVCTPPLPHSFSSPHPSLFLPSPSRLFASLIDMFPFSKLLSLNHIHSSFNDHFSFSHFHSLLRYAIRVHLTPVLPAIPGGPYFTQCARPVLVRAVDWVEAVGYNDLQGPTQWDNQVSLCKWLGFSHDDLGWK